MRAPLLALVLAAALLLASACASPCMEVQRILCTCVGNTQSRQSACEDDASSQEGLDPPDEAQLATCEALIDPCQAQVDKGCDTLQTPEGKRACGFALD